MKTNFINEIYVLILPTCRQTTQQVFYKIKILSFLFLNLSGKRFTFIFFFVYLEYRYGQVGKVNFSFTYSQNWVGGWNEKLRSHLSND